MKIKPDIHPFNRLIRKLLLFTIAVPACIGCSTIDEGIDRVDCYTDAFLRFEYTYHLGSGDRFTEVDMLDLYFYDETGNYYASKSLLSAELQQGNLYSLNWLPVGKYTIVVWGTTTAARAEQTPYLKEYQPHIDDMRYGLQCENGDGLVTTRPGHLFYGRLAIEATQEREVFTTSLFKNSNDIHIIIEGTGSNTPDYTVRITSRNGSYNYANDLSPADHRVMQYIAGFTANEDLNLQADLTVMRLFADDPDARISIYDPASGIEVLNDRSILDEIMTDQIPPTYAEEYLERQDEYTLVYKMVTDPDGAALLTIVRVNDWTPSEGNGHI